MPAGSRTGLDRHALSRLLAGDDHSLFGLHDHLVDHGFQVASAPEDRELTIGARALLEDPEGVFDFLPAAELVENVVDEPLQHLTDELAGWQFPLLSEVDHLAVEPVA